MGSKVKIYSQEGKEVGEIELESKIFAAKIRPELVQQAVRTLAANRRRIIAHTRDRSEVSGGGKKPWRQKGTGRARHGSIRSPIWKGGGVAFGPRKDRNYSLKMNKKARQAALFSVLSDKAGSGDIIVLEKLELPKIKTKELIKIIDKLPVKEEKSLIILSKSNFNVKKSASNTPKLGVLPANSLNVISLLKYKYLIIVKSALEVINKTYLGSK